MQADTDADFTRAAEQTLKELDLSLVSWDTANIPRGMRMLHNGKVFGLDIRAGSLLTVVWFLGLAVFSVTL